VDAEDVFQVGAMRALERASTLVDPERALPWVRRVLARCAIDAARAPRLEIAQSSAEEVESAPPDAETCACSVGLLGTLPANYREALERVVVGDEPLDALAHEAGITKGNAAVRVLRARRALRKRLAEHCGVQSARECAACSCAHRGCCASEAGSPRAT
jgi:RNA polymerase sigma-70 factor (ECF subfamily)